MGIMKRSRRNATRNPIRLALVVVLLGTSLLFVAAMVVLNDIAQTRVQEIRSQLGTGITIIPVRGTFTEQQLATAEQTPGVVSYAEETLGPCAGPQVHIPPPPPDFPSSLSSSSGGHEPRRSRHGGSDDVLLCYGFTPGAAITMMVKGSIPGGDAPHVIEGRTFSTSERNANVALMGTTLAEFNHLTVGSVFTLNGASLTLIGIYSTGSTYDAGILLPIQTALRMLHLNQSEELTVFASRYDQVPALASTLHQRLGNQFQLSTTQGQFDQPITTLTLIEHTSLLMLIAALLTAVLVIMFTSFLTVRERSKEIGVLKALGASNWQVVGQLGVEVLQLSVLATVVSALLLLLTGPTITSAAVVLLPSNHGQLVTDASVLIPPAQTLTITLTLKSALVLLGAGIALAVLASTVPTCYIVRLKPAQVLRSR